MWVVYAFGSAFFGGITSILAKCGIKQTDSNVATAIRTIVVWVCSWMMVFLVGSQKTIADVDMKSWVFLILSGLATGASWLCYFRALQLGDINKVVSIDKSSTVLTMLMAFAFLNETVTWLKILSIILIGSGTYCMLERKKSVSIEKRSRMWMVYALLSALFAAFTAVLGKIGISGLESNLGTAIRTGVVLVMAWVVVFVSGKQHTVCRIHKKELYYICLSGIATGGSWLCYFRALQAGDVNKVVPVDKSSTVLTMALAFIFLHESISPLKCICMVMILAGTLLMIEKKKTDSPGSNSAKWLPYAILSAVFAALTSILGKIGIDGVSSDLGTAIRTAVVLVMAWLMVPVTGKADKLRGLDKRELLFIALSGLATGGSWLCYYKALQDGPASVVVPIDKLSILVSILFSYIVFHEKLTKRSAAGLAILVAGTLLMLVG